MDPSRQLTQTVRRVWDERHGLPQNSVQALAQTSDGYLWIGTLEGLVRFDGARFVVFDRRSNPELTSNRLQALAEDPGGYLFVGTENGGALRFDGSRFQPLAAPAGEAAPAPRTARALLVEPDGDLWVGGQRDLWRLPRGAIILERVAAGLGVWGLWRHPDGALWVGADDGVWRGTGRHFDRVALPAELAALPARAFTLDRDGVSVLAAMWAAAGVVRLRPGAGGSWLRPTVEPLLRGPTVVNLLHDRNGSLWLSSEGHGLLRLVDGRLQRLSTAEGFPSDFVMAMLEDREGNLWVGPDTGGLAQLRDGKVEVLSSAEGLSGDFVLSLLEDDAGDLWVGTYGRGLDRVRRRPAGGYQVIRHTRAHGLPDDWVWSLLRERPGTLLVGTYQGLVRVRDGVVAPVPHARLGNAWIRALLADRRGRLWLGADSGLYELRGSELVAHHAGLPDPAVLSLLEDRAGTLWVGTRRGLYRRRGARLDAAGHPVLASAAVRALYQDGGGILWAGTEGHGLFALQSGRVRRWTTAEGLYDDLISAILEDDLGFLWLSSNKGLFRVRRAALLAPAGPPPALAGQVLDAADGMPRRETSGGSQPAAWKGRDGRLWFATIRGAVAVDPRRIPRNALPPPVHVEELWVDERRWPAGLAPRLPPGRRAVRIDYTATSFVAPERVRFRFRLAGFQDHWVDAGGRRSAFYTNLPPGRYRFEVRAANDDGVWNETGATLALEQLPYFWQTGWFRGVLAAVALLLPALVYGLRGRALRRRAVELEAQVSERTQRLEQEKRKTESQAARLAQLDAAKSRFFANISHELRTPLTLVLGPVDAALAGSYGALDERLRQRLAGVARSARLQLRLVDQLLQLARLESGKLVLARRAVDLATMVGVLCDAFASLAEQRGVALRREIEPTAPFAGDPEKLEQVLVNLLSNALKYTPAGGEVVVRLGLVGAPGDGVSLQVADTGCGIPPEQRAHLFERFFRAGEGAAPGTGLGLSLSRELVQLHGGTLEVASEPGRGSTFTVQLPAAPLPEVPPTAAWSPGSVTAAELTAAGAVAPPTRGSPTPHAWRPRRLAGQRAPLALVVDDHPQLRAFLAECLTPSFRIVEAGDGAAALAAIEREMPDLVVSDVMMAPLDGFELCRALRADPALDHLPVILLTARADREDRLAGLRLGADEYLPKPFDRDELLARASGLVQRRRRLRERYRSDGVVRISDLAATPLDESFLARAVAAIEAQIDDPGFGVDGLARALAMSPRNLQRKLRALTGETPQHFLQTLRLQRASQLLERRAGNVSEVAFAVGFSDLAAFSRAFRRRYGKPPSALLAGR